MPNGTWAMVVDTKSNAEVARKALKEGINDFVLPASVYAEVLVGPIRTGVAAVRSLEQFVQEFAIQIEPLTPAVARRAAELRASTTSLRLPHAFVLATADVLRATTILTSDKKWVGLSPRVQLL